jgi:ABC-type nitrate/sulfonate/bicarbonate transport system substrate-binding protein
MNNCHRKVCSLFFATMVAVILALQANELALAQSKKDDISIGYASPSGMFTPLFIAQERGLFKKYGLGVKELLLLRGTGPRSGANASGRHSADRGVGRCFGGGRNAWRRTGLYREHVEPLDFLPLFPP